MYCEGCGYKIDPLDWSCPCLDDEDDYDPEDDFLYGCWLMEEVYPYCTILEGD